MSSIDKRIEFVKNDPKLAKAIDIARRNMAHAQRTVTGTLVHSSGVSAEFRQSEWRGETVWSANLVVKGRECRSFITTTTLERVVEWLEKEAERLTA